MDDNTDVDCSFCCRVNEVLAALHLHRHRRAVTPSSYPLRLQARSLPLTPAALSAHIRRELGAKPPATASPAGVPHVLEDGSTPPPALPNALDLVHVPLLCALQEAVSDEQLRLTEEVTQALWRRLLAETACSLHKAFQ